MGLADDAAAHRRLLRRRVRAGAAAEGQRHGRQRDRHRARSGRRRIGARAGVAGSAEVSVGVSPPPRRTFDVKVAGGALLSNPISLQQQGAFGQPLDILLGDPARLRGYEVNFGVLRGFRAETALPTPKIEAKLELATDRVRGTVTNDSDEKTEAAAGVFGGSLVRLGDLVPGQTVSVAPALGASNVFGLPLGERLLGSQSGGGDPASRITLTRRTVIDQLTAYTGKFSTLVGTIGGDGAMLVGWRTAPTLAGDVGGQQGAQAGEAGYRP